LSEVDELSVLAREVKQRNDSLEQFKKAGRDDLVKQVEKELEILKAYMPEPLSDEELEDLIKQAIEQTGATDKKDFGKVMGVVMPQVKGKADGARVQKLVQKLLS